MTKLSATDAGFLYAETATTPMSIASVQLLSLPSEVTHSEFVATLQTFISKRLHLVPYLTSKLQWPGGWLDHPNWVRDANFDITQHIYAIPVAAPGGQRQLEQTVAQLHQEPLPRHRPLWDIVVLTGLADGRIAYYNRVHHACLDGMAAQASTQLLMDSKPTGHTDPVPGKSALPATAGPQRSTADHVLSLFESLCLQAVNSFAEAPARMAASQRLWQRAMDPDAELGAFGQRAPATMLNCSIDKGRTYAMGELPLTTMRDLARSTKSTLNDVFVSLCGGALRRYLQRHNQLPEQSLLAACPVSLRKPGDKSTNNQVTMMKVSLDTLTDNPLIRLRNVGQSARTAKQVLADAVDLISADLTAPGLGASMQGAAQLANLMPAAEWVSPSANVVISNVPGPRKVLYSNGARVLSHYPVSIPAQGMAVNITVQSYAQQLFFGITACARAVPDADRLRDDLLAEFSALEAALRADVVDFATGAATPVSSPTASNSNGFNEVA
ncbi:MAG: wax ester/triacylglycerol synthase family O-acyltransferase [Pseudomonadota bacterium]